MARLTTFLLGLLAGVLTTAATGPARGADDPSTRDLDQLQGTWVTSSLHRRGKLVLGEEKLKGVVLIVRNDTWHHGRTDDEREAMRVELDASKTPREVNLTQTQLGKRMTLRGIYELRGDRLKLRIGSGSDQRPTSFDVGADADHPLWTFRRDRAK